MTDCLLVMTTLPSREIAKALAQNALEQKLAACINIIPNITSLYTWEGKVCEEDECLLLIKTTQSRYAELEGWLRSEHPYTLPELIVTPITQGLPDYLGWIKESTQQ